MLLLRRKPQQSVTLAVSPNPDSKDGFEITVTVTKMEGQTVQLGFDAPPDVHILRTELVNPADVGLDD